MTWKTCLRVALTTSLLSPLMVSPALAVKGDVDVYNDTKRTIVVVMDSNRETHKIAAGKVARFKKASVGDKPTFRCKNTDGSEFDTKSVVVPAGKRAKVHCKG